MGDVTGVLTTPAPEDSGARTADLFDWQAAVAAADGLAIAANYKQEDTASDTAIICEHHEDYVVLLKSSVELVSVKHRELSQGSWTWATLADDGGLAHLFNRWRALGATCRTRMVTNAGLSAGDPATLAKACSSLRDPPHTSDIDIKRLVRLLAIEFIVASKISDIPQEWRVEKGTPKKDIEPPIQLLAQVENFMASLEFDTGRPHRDHIFAASPEKYAEPVLGLCQLPSTAARAAWEAVLSLFRQRMRGRGAVQLGELASVVAMIKGETSRGSLERTLRARTISAEDVVVAVETAALAQDAYDPGTYPVAGTRLHLKLVDGGCTATTSHAAEAHVEYWRRTRRERVADVPGIAAEFMMAELDLLRLASQASERAVAMVPPGTKYGPQMWQELVNVAVPSVLSDLPMKVDNKLVLGGLCDLASQCRVWFGPPFDVEAAQRAYRAASQKAIGEAS